MKRMDHNRLLALLAAYLMTAVLLIGFSASYFGGVPP